MMLAEHRQKINERLKQAYYEEDVSRSLDEQTLEEWQHALMESIHFKRDIIIIYNQVQRKEVKGIVMNILQDRELVYLQTPMKEQLRIPLLQIIDIRLVDF